ncbi:Transposase [Oopsacas minuta]|uniref:Transposase n=1 Tax=Oopsacas minuta TaxID=111878 RepID=A0AAV7K978_9METZ|nr:Transposase [Oopsacas minuta]
MRGAVNGVIVRLNRIINFKVNPDLGEDCSENKTFAAHCVLHRLNLSLNDVFVSEDAPNVVKILADKIELVVKYVHNRFARSSGRRHQYEKLIDVFTRVEIPGSWNALGGCLDILQYAPLFAVIVPLLPALTRMTSRSSKVGKRCIEIIGCMAVDCSIAERGFSQLARLKTRLRNRLSGEHLNSAMSLRLNPVSTVSEILAAWRGQRFRRVRNVQNPGPRLVFQHATDIEKIEDQFDSDYSERDGEVAEDSDDWSSEDEDSDSDIESEMELWKKVAISLLISNKNGDFTGSIHTILTTELGYRSICGKWVPHKLNENQRLARLNIAKKLLETYENCASRRLTEIITGDETWVYYSAPYSKYKKRSWVRGDEQPAKIPMPDFRIPKIMYTIFFSSHGIVLQLPCKSGKAVTATFFPEQVLPNLIKDIEKYRPKTGTRGMKILIDNASSHTAKLTKNFLDVEGLELLPRPPYSPDLAPCDFGYSPSSKSTFKAKILTHYKHSERACTSTSNPSPKKSTEMCFRSGRKG